MSYLILPGTLQYYDQILGNARSRLDGPISCKMESKSSALANHAILFLVFLDMCVKLDVLDHSLQM